MNQRNKIQRQYNKICEKLEQLNSEAFELEKTMMYLDMKEENDNKRIN